MSESDGLFALLSIMAGIIPTAAYVLLVWRAGRYEKEPFQLLAVAFLWGAIPAVVISALVEVAFDVPLAALSEGLAEIFSSSLIAPPVEEGLKGLALLGLFALARREFDGVLDGIIYGALIGFGFAMTENIFYFVGAWDEGGLERWSYVVLARSLAFGLNHAMFTSLTGIGFGLARDTSSARKGALFVLLGLSGAISAHFFHNFFLATSNLCLLSFIADWAGVLIVFAIIILAWRREKVWLQTQLSDEVTGGVLTPVQFETILSPRQRIKRSWQLLGISGVRQARLWRKLVDAATELAFRKYRRAVLGEERDNDATITALRAQIVHLRQTGGDELLTGQVPCDVCGRPLADGVAQCPHCGAGRPAAPTGPVDPKGSIHSQED